MRIFPSILIAGALTVGAVSPATAAPVPTRPTLHTQAQAIVDAGAPGAVITVSDQRGTRSAVAGQGDLRRHTRPDPDGRFRIGSVTKTFTATVVLQLVAEGRLRLGAPVSRYLPRLLPYAKPITVRQLLMHRSGLFDYKDTVWPDLETVVARRFHTYTPRQLVAMATREPLQSTPGTTFLYSNTDYVVLGLLIEKVTGHSFAAELSSRILRPLRMRHTYLAGAAPGVPGAAMRGYESVDGSPIDLTAYDMSVSWSAGAIISTARELNRFYVSLLRGRLLPPEQLHQMEQTRRAFYGFRYGLGLARGSACGQPIWGHVGGVPGYDTYAFTTTGGQRVVTVDVNEGLNVSDEVNAQIVRTVKSELCR